jgi:hypothetical protein
MSGVGHEHPFCKVCGTSALLPILTVRADVVNRKLRAITGRCKIIFPLASLSRFPSTNPGALKRLVADLDV